MNRIDIVICGKPAVLACDGLCSKAWGVAARPKEQLGDDVDDVAYLADHELGEAPAHSGTFEGGFDKPASCADMNKWCARQCERSVVAPEGQPVVLPSFAQRLYNQPWKHQS